MKFVDKYEPVSKAMKLFYNHLTCDKCKEKVRQADDYFNLANDLQKEIRAHIEKGHKDE